LTLNINQTSLFVNDLNTKDNSQTTADNNEIPGASAHGDKNNRPRLGEQERRNPNISIRTSTKIL